MKRRVTKLEQKVFSPENLDVADLMWQARFRLRTLSVEERENERRQRWSKSVPAWLSEARKRWEAMLPQRGR